MNIDVDRQPNTIIPADAACLTNLPAAELRVIALCFVPNMATPVNLLGEYKVYLKTFRGQSHQVLV